MEEKEPGKEEEEELRAGAGDVTGNRRISEMKKKKESELFIERSFFSFSFQTPCGRDRQDERVAKLRTDDRRTTGTGRKRRYSLYSQICFRQGHFV